MDREYHGERKSTITGHILYRGSTTITQETLWTRQEHRVTEQNKDTRPKGYTIGTGAFHRHVELWSFNI